MKRIYLILAIAASLGLAGALSYYFIVFQPNQQQASIQSAVNIEKSAKADFPEREFLYGIRVDNKEVVKNEIEPNQFFSDILLDCNVDYPSIHSLMANSSDVFDAKKVRAGNNYTIITSESLDDSLAKPDQLVYEKNKIEYVVFQLNEDSMYAYQGRKPVDTVNRAVGGVINSSLYLTMDEKNINTQLAIEMSSIYAWTIDFYRIQKGDYFKVIYDELYVEGESIGVSNVHGTLFNHFGKDLYSFNYKDDSLGHDRFYDETGFSLRQAFLQAPVKYTRISSKFTKKRFHPVQKKWKSHLGTDYAAPSGTPIYATADGVILKRGYTRGNGNYVKVKHNDVYTTQYLHMSKFADLKEGDYVNHGQTIGYVGMTGLATGPHVCYRFWKNGQQVDPYADHDLPKANPISEEEKPAFLAFIEPLKIKLDAIDENATLEELEEEIPELKLPLPLTSVLFSN